MRLSANSQELRFTEHQMANRPHNPHAPQTVGWVSFLFPLVLLALGAARLIGGGESGYALAWSIAMLALGSLCLLLLVHARLAMSISARLARQTELAEQSRFEFGDAAEADFVRADREFYELATVELTTNGFHLMRDAVNLTIGKIIGQAQLPIRYFLGDGGTTSASVYEMKLSGWLRLFVWFGPISRRIKMIECESELSDSTYIITDNAAPMRYQEIFPFIDRQSLPTPTSAAALVQFHREHVRAVLASKPGVVLVQLHTFDEMQESALRQRRLRAASRKPISEQRSLSTR